MSNRLVMVLMNSQTHFAAGLWVDGASRRVNGLTPRALLGVDLHEVKGPKQMLQAALLILGDEDCTKSWLKLI